MNGFRWAIRESFLRYVSAQHDGRIRVAGGTTVVDGYHFLFPLAQPDDGQIDRETGDIHRYTGEVEFSAHFGLLLVSIQDPWIERSGADAEVTVARGGGRLTFATCQVAPDPGSGSLVGRDVRLTNDGADLFGGSYALGELLEPFVASIEEPAPLRRPSELPARP